MLDFPENQERCLNYFRRTGKLAGIGKHLNCDDQTITNYCSSHPKFKARVELAKKNFDKGEFDDLQRLWNRNAELYNNATIERIFELLLEGHRETEHRICSKPKKVKGEIVLDKDGEPVMEINQEFWTYYTKPTPKWVMELAMELVQDTYGEPELLKLAPTIILQFVTYLKGEVKGLKGDLLQDVLGKAGDFEKVLKSQVLALKGKTIK